MLVVRYGHVPHFTTQIKLQVPSIKGHPYLSSVLSLVWQTPIDSFVVNLLFHPVPGSVNKGLFRQKTSCVKLWTGLYGTLINFPLLGTISVSTVIAKSHCCRIVLWMDMKWMNKEAGWVWGLVVAVWSCYQVSVMIEHIVDNNGNESHSCWSGSNNHYGVTAGFTAPAPTDHIPCAIPILQLRHWRLGRPISCFIVYLGGEETVTGPGHAEAMHTAEITIVAYNYQYVTGPLFALLPHWVYGCCLKTCHTDD